MTMTYRRLLLPCAFVGLALTIAACAGTGTGQQTATETVTVGAEQPAADGASGDSTSTAEPAGDQVDVALPADWPDADFPVPPGVSITGRQHAGGAGILIVGKDPADVAEFYRSALPAAGYRIVEDSSVGVGGVQVVGIQFSGNGYDGDLAVVNNSVSISLVKR